MYASLHLLSDAVAPCGCSTSPTTSRSPNNAGCTCTSTSYDGEEHATTLVEALSGAAVPKGHVVGALATFGGLKVQFQAGDSFRIRFQMFGASSNVSTIPIAITPHNLALAMNPGGAGVDWRGQPVLNSNGSSIYVDSVMNADGIADGVGDGCLFVNQPQAFLQGNGYDLNGLIAQSNLNATLVQPPGGPCHLVGTSGANVNGRLGFITFTNLGVNWSVCVRARAYEYIVVWVCL